MPRQCVVLQPDTKAAPCPGGRGRNVCGCGHVEQKVWRGEPRKTILCSAAGVGHERISSAFFFCANAAPAPKPHPKWSVGREPGARPPLDSAGAPWVGLEETRGPSVGLEAPGRAKTLLLSPGGDLGSAEGVGRSGFENWGRSGAMSPNGANRALGCPSGRI